MRLKRLILQAFGHFSDKRFDFGEKQPNKSDFHLFYGRNEAGKTTLMEAWLRLLFGIPKNESYAFQHKRPNLKLSALLEAEGREIAVTRVPKGHNSVLLDKNGNNADAALLPFLQNLDEQRYRNLLCLDDTVIEKGSQGILDSKGEMGSLLFSAAAGLADFPDMLKQQEEESDRLYRPRASSSFLAELRRDYDEIKKQLAAAEMSAEQYGDLKQKAAAADKNEQQARTEQKTAAHRLAVLKTALDLYRRHESLILEFADNVNKIADNLMKLGLAENLLQAADDAERYQNLRAFTLNARQIEELRQARAAIEGLAEKKAETERNLAQTERKSQESEQDLVQLWQTLPLPEESEKLSAALEHYQGGQLKQNYRMAREKQNTLKQRLQNALAELTTPQGAVFAALPALSLSARDAENLRDAKRAALAEKAEAEKSEKAALARLEQIKAKLNPINERQDW